jgi:succinylglutamate desuccinylase
MTTITLDDGSAQNLASPDALAASNCGTPGVWRFESAQPGQRIVITALVHGNEVCGAAALWDVVQQKPMPRSGSLTLVFCNLAAYAKLDDANKDECRLVDEDLNRVWGRLEQPASEADTCEMRRAREILPFVADADVLLDIHSMTSPAPALGLVGRAAKNVKFAQRIGYPALLVQDAGHAAGLRLIDRQPFASPEATPVAMLIECGAHFSRAAFDAAAQVVARMLSVYVEGAQVEVAEPQSVIEVTQAVTIRSDNFEFVGDWPNMACVPEAGTLIAHDGEDEVRMPYDDTYMVMPASARYRKPGLTAVRFGRKVAERGMSPYGRSSESGNLSS